MSTSESWVEIHDTSAADHDEISTNSEKTSVELSDTTRSLDTLNPSADMSSEGYSSAILKEDPVNQEPAQFSPDLEANSEGRPCLWWCCL